MTRLALFICRDIGYGTETGIVQLPALGSPDWTGKRPYRLWSNGSTVYLFDDELGLTEAELAG